MREDELDLTSRNLKVCSPGALRELLVHPGAKPPKSCATAVPVVLGRFGKPPTTDGELLRVEQVQEECYTEVSESREGESVATRAADRAEGRDNSGQVLKLSMAFAALVMKMGPNKHLNQCLMWYMPISSLTCRPIVQYPHDSRPLRTGRSSELNAGCSYSSF